MRRSTLNSQEAKHCCDSCKDGKTCDSEKKAKRNKVKIQKEDRELLNYDLSEEVLIENRLKDAEKTYGSKIGAGTVKELSKADPSGKNKYLGWASKRVANGEFKKAVIASMVAFHKNSARLKKRDINQYKTAKEVDKAISTLGKSRGQKQKIVRSQADKVYEDDRFLVIHPKSTKASQKYGAGTKWCTAATSSDNYFCRYSGSDNIFLYYVIAKEPLNDPYTKIALALHPGARGEGEYFDSTDDAMTLGEVKIVLGRSSRKLFSSVYKHMTDKEQTDANKALTNIKSTDYKFLADVKITGTTPPPVIHALRDAVKSNSAPSWFLTKIAENYLADYYSDFSEEQFQLIAHLIRKLDEYSEVVMRATPAGDLMFPTTALDFLKGVAIKAKHSKDKVLAGRVFRLLGFDTKVPYNRKLQIILNFTGLLSSDVIYSVVDKARDPAIPTTVLGFYADQLSQDHIKKLVDKNNKHSEFAKVFLNKVKIQKEDRAPLNYNVRIDAGV